MREGWREGERESEKPLMLILVRSVVVDNSCPATPQAPGVLVDRQTRATFLSLTLSTTVSISRKRQGSTTPTTQENEPKLMIAGSPFYVLRLYRSFLDRSIDRSIIHHPDNTPSAILLLNSWWTSKLPSEKCRRFHPRRRGNALLRGSGGSFGGGSRHRRGCGLTCRCY